MSDNTKLISQFYEAFSRRDADTMATCYHAEATFSDPAFPDLKGEQIGAMWRMLCGRAKDLRVEFREISADETTGKAHWEAWYPFSATGLQVHNIIDASFEFRDGKIFRHTDHFDFPRWAKQALGLKGLLLGRTNFLRKIVRKNAGAALQNFMQKQT